MYEEYYLNQAKQKGGNLPVFHGARFQQGYGLGSTFKGLFRWAMPHLQQGAKVLGKKALQTGPKWLKMFWKEIMLTQRWQSVVKKLFVDYYLRLEVVEKLQKEKCSFVVYPRSRNEKHLCWIKTKTTFNFGRKFKWDSLATL